MIMQLNYRSMTVDYYRIRFNPSKNANLMADLIYHSPSLKKKKKYILSFSTVYIVLPNNWQSVKLLQLQNIALNCLVGQLKLCFVIFFVCIIFICWPQKKYIMLTNI